MSWIEKIGDLLSGKDQTDAVQRSDRNSVTAMVSALQRIANDAAEREREASLLKSADEALMQGIEAKAKQARMMGYRRVFEETGMNGLVKEVADYYKSCKKQGNKFWGHPSVTDEEIKGNPNASKDLLYLVEVKQVIGEHEEWISSNSDGFNITVPTNRATHFHLLYGSDNQYSVRIQGSRFSLHYDTAHRETLNLVKEQLSEALFQNKD